MHKPACKIIAVLRASTQKLKGSRTKGACRTSMWSLFNDNERLLAHFSVALVVISARGRGCAESWCSVLPGLPTARPIGANPSFS